MKIQSMLFGVFFLVAIQGCVTKEAGSNMELKKQLEYINQLEVQIRNLSLALEESKTALDAIQKVRKPAISNAERHKAHQNRVDYYALNQQIADLEHAIRTLKKCIDAVKIESNSYSLEP